MLSKFADLLPSAADSVPCGGRSAAAVSAYEGVLVRGRMDFFLFPRFAPSRAEKEVRTSIGLPEEEFLFKRISYRNHQGRR